MRYPSSAGTGPSLWNSRDPRALDWQCPWNHWTNEQVDCGHSLLRIHLSRTCGRVWWLEGSRQWWGFRTGSFSVASQQERCPIAATILTIPMLHLKLQLWKFGMEERETWSSMEVLRRRRRAAKGKGLYSIPQYDSSSLFVVGLVVNPEWSNRNFISIGVFIGFICNRSAFNLPAKWKRLLKGFRKRWIMPVESASMCPVHRHSICQDHGVKGYPTVLLFEAYSGNGITNDRSKLHPYTVLGRFGYSAVEVESPSPSCFARCCQW